MVSLRIELGEECIPLRRLGAFAGASASPKSLMATSMLSMNGVASQYMDRRRVGENEYQSALSVKLPSLAIWKRSRSVCCAGVRSPPVQEGGDGVTVGIELGEDDHGARQRLLRRRSH